ncbi:cytochrome c5 family protein [bacterium M00.F.Ca.ET.228.01.1.1]|uniref:c-type cytochrome n=1 Tax=Paraburkholderia phenoliruptrix TaxID=252970 RepID=UPI001091C273|nr:c-type cytochrome [Paraburkholderia phenoliruptrix]TGP45032.1 cytochrome c5 family protein [bacterium M00.F.Ca.ET.228.01.1.1]TGS02915.1 cytochrome c5 family protein [bacterium M00.F.Ca.ET.191.01.1.1]TGU06297.1 cytochrome c5 family protein [bacterium M00.F.Ca.ET.155.01.1.1]MBW0448914.1 cytochrome c5 family protein [Paraburkholderia phenoliruptrix]MBW9097891.1 cytochrome c5 family protein [Paraburkholderia phenoliruptrix]
MSEAPHGAPIKTPGQLVAAVIAGFAVPIIIIVLLAYYVDNSTRTGAGTDSLSEAEVTARIKPIAQVEIRDANAPRVYKTGEEVYKAVCSACHASGAAGAPKFTNTADWAPRISQGFDTLLHAALAGKGAMPPRGGTSPDDFSDFEIARAVAYMANNSGASFPEPAQPASGAAAASAAAGASAATAGAGGASDAGAAQAAAAMAAMASVPQAAAAPASGATQSADASQAGKALYQQVCQACHAAGVLNAPKFGDKEAWAPRLKEPMDTVYNYALHGKGAMPPKGGSNASDADVKAAVDYMVSAVK